MGASPDESFPFQIVNLGMVDMAFLSANLIDAYELDISIVFLLPAVGHSSIHRASNRVPGDVEKPGHLIPGQQSGPEGKHGDKRKTDGLLAHVPRYTFHLDSMFNTFDSARTIVKKDSDTPKGDVAPSPLSALIPRTGSPAANAARQLPSFFGIQLDPQFVVDEFARNDTMIRDSQSETTILDMSMGHPSVIQVLIHTS